jgi:hypothetical protein
MTSQQGVYLCMTQFWVNMYEIANICDVSVLPDKWRRANKTICRKRRELIKHETVS